MNKEEAKHISEVLKAYSEGKTIQFKVFKDSIEPWKEINDSKIEELIHNKVQLRIKPELKYKRVSFKVAKAIKEAGYPQGPEDYAYRSNGAIYIFEDMFDHIPDYCCDAPTYIEVWLWLWREKRITLEPIQNGCKLFMGIEGYDGKFIECSDFDPEKSIIAAIEYLVDNNLIK